MKLDAIGVTSRNISKSVEFYRLLGFKFPEIKKGEQHVESLPKKGSAKLMIDGFDLIKDMLGYDPSPSNHSVFAIQYKSSKKVDEIAKKVKEAGFTVFKDPWDAFWGQRYAIVEDPDGYKIDLYASL